RRVGRGVGELPVRRQQEHLVGPGGDGVAYRKTLGDGLSVRLKLDGPEEIHQTDVQRLLSADEVISAGQEERTVRKPVEERDKRQDAIGVHSAGVTGNRERSPLSVATAVGGRS